MTTIEDAATRLGPAESVAPDAFLGRICWYSVPEATRIGHMEFCRELVGRGLDEYHLPLAPKPVDVFRRASKAVQGHHQLVGPEGVLINVNFLVREVSYSDTEVHRALVREVMDAQGDRLWFDQVANIRFNRKKGFVKTKHTPPDDMEVEGWTNQVDHACRVIEDEKLNEVKRNFTTNNDYLTAYVVRETVRKILARLNATVMRDGVYFVAEDKVEHLDLLDELVNDIDGASFHSLPLVDDSKQREMLKASFLDDSLGQIDDLIGRMAAIMRDDDTRITSRRYADFQVLRTELRDRAEAYKDLLEVSLGETEARLEVLDEQLWALVERVKKEDK